MLVFFISYYIAPGAGVISGNTNSTLTISDTIFKSNNATNNNGGGIGFGDNCTATISRCGFDDNASGYAGGGISARKTCNVKVVGSTFNSKSAVFTGGAINADDDSVLTVSDSSFDSNSVSVNGFLAEPFIFYGARSGAIITVTTSRCYHNCDHQ
jgi:hypothetical protein